MDLKTGLPYWLIKNGLPYQYPKLLNSVKTEVAVIGGGISGALSAYYLSKAGIDCVMIDRRTIGLGSTCASTSLVQYELDKPLYELSELTGKSRAERVYKRCESAVKELMRLAGNLQFKDLEPVPSLFYAAKKSHAPGIEREYRARKALGLDVEQLDRKQIQKRYGFEAAAAIVSSTACSIDAYSLCHHLCSAAVKKGLRIYDRTRVTGTRETKNGVELVTDDGFTIRCRYVVNACGYEATDSIDRNIVKLVSTYAFASENIDDKHVLWEDRAMIWNTADPYLYMRLTADNRIIVGGRDEQIYSPAARDKLIKRKSAQLVRDFTKLFPAIALKPEFTWTGTFGVTRDALPYIGSISMHPRIYYALGFGGNGITFSLIAAQIISRIISGKKDEDLELFSFART